MKITEIESQIEMEKEGALITLLNMMKSKADAKNTGVKISIQSLNKLMQNLGYSIGYAEIDSLAKSNQAIDNLIQDYNDDFVTVSTNTTIDKSNDDFEPGNQDTVKKMAKRATNRRD